MSKNPFTGKRRLVYLHSLVWATILVISFVSMIQEDGVGRSAMAACSGCFFSALVIYGNISFLYPRYYETKRYGWYAAGAALLLVVGGLPRGYMYQIISNASFATAPHWLGIQRNITFLLPAITVFILSFVFRLAMAYFVVKQQSEEMLLQRSQIELKLLKAQVQPHFLFNTLNTMYYESFVEAPRTAALIERLSGIMRYFVDQSSQEYVRLATEMEFIDNYIALERIRINPEPEIIFTRHFDGERMIPPMLLMTFVENIFKHGIDKITGINRIELSLCEKDDALFFETKNLLNRHADPRQGEGLGLKNLRQRLEILYGERFELQTRKDEDHFTANLKLPLT